MTYVMTIREETGPWFEFEDATGRSSGEGYLPFYHWVGSEKVTDLSNIPTSARQTRKGKLTDAFWVANAGLVSPRFKDLIEEIEPDTHQFFPVALKDIDGTPYPDQYFIWHVTQQVACVMFKESDNWPIGSVKYGPTVGQPIYSCHDTGLVISKSAFSHRKIFTTGAVCGGELIIPDDMVRKIKKQGIKFLRMHPVVEVDRPWLPEENCPELLAYNEEHPDQAVSFEPL